MMYYALTVITGLGWIALGALVWIAFGLVTIFIDVATNFITARRINQYSSDLHKYKIILMFGPLGTFVACAAVIVLLVKVFIDKVVTVVALNAYETIARVENRISKK